MMAAEVIMPPNTSAKSLCETDSNPDFQLKFNEAPLSNFYELSDELGCGQFASVRRVVERRTGELYAAKFVRKRRYKTSRRGVPREHIEREIKVLRLVSGHENVIELKEVFETPTDIVLILELVSGGELFDHVCANEYLDEAEASAFIKQILYGLQHLHRNHVVHMDIKPENIMLKRRNESQIKLIDFGLSRIILPGAQVKEMVGTPEFVAPEVVNFEPLSSATDMWALGVVTYILLSGGSPFLGRNRDETFCNITSVKYHEVNYLSKLAKDFISRLFVRDMRRRATVEDCLQHPWIRPELTELAEMRRASSIVTGAQLKSFKVRMRWRKAADLVRLCVRIAQRERARVKEACHNGTVVESKYNRNDVVTSAILIACEEGNLDALEQLVNIHRLDLNIINTLGEGPLHFAAGGTGNEQVVAYLQRRGVPTDLEDSRGDTPLFWAARHGRSQLIRYMVKHRLANVKKQNKSLETPLHAAVRYLQTETVLALLEVGADVDVQDESGEAPIHIAAWNNSPIILSILCRFSPMLTLKNKDNETALHLAATRGHLECVQSLLEAGASLDTQDQTGQTALHLALRRSHTEIALLLITKDCNFDLPDENGDTPLMIAARLGLVGLVQTLCHVGALVNVQNKQSLTSLHQAAREGHLEVIRCLLLSGADTSIENKEGDVAEQIAFHAGHDVVTNFLAKMESESYRSQCIEQLYVLETPLRRIKLKLFGHSEVGKSRLVQSLQSNGFVGSFIDAVSRRFSDNLSTSNVMVEKSKRMSDEGIHSCSSSTSSESAHNVIEKRKWTSSFCRPLHQNYTTGIDVQNVNFPGCGEFSCWEFGGYEPYHVLYDHFVGNTDCIHCIVISCLDPTEVQYKEVLYWMNFLKGRVTPSEPISHCGVVSRLSKVIVIGTHATSAQFPNRNADGEYTNSDVDAMLKTIRLRFETHFDIHDRLVLLDSTNTNCPGMKALRQYLQQARTAIVQRLQKPLALLDQCVNYLGSLRKVYINFPVITWPDFTSSIRTDVNPLTSDSHCRQLIQQLQLIGEVVYLRDEVSELDYVVLSPEWLGTHILGTLLSAQFLSSCRLDGCYTLKQFAPIFPEITETELLLPMLDTLQMCAPIDDDRFEFPAFVTTEAPKDIWLRNKPNFVYGGLRILPMRGMERSLQSTFVRLQVALRRSMNDFSDPMDADLRQYLGCSKMSSGKMEALVRLQGDAVEIQVRGPKDQSASCVYFLEDIANLVEQTCNEVAPGISLERHFLSPKHLREHRLQPASFPPEEIMAMQQRESLTIRNTDGEQELFTNVVCFGSREVAAVLTLGVDVSVSQLQLTARCELAALLDPPNKFGCDWSILAVKLNLTDQLPEVDSTGQSLSRTDQLLAEWALQAPESASIGRLCSILEEMGRVDARDLLFRTVPLYLFANIDEPHVSDLAISH